MKYVTPMLEKTEIEVNDVIAASGDISVVEKNNGDSVGADYLIDLSKLFF